MTLTEYVFMTEVRFIVNAKNGACATFYTWNLRFGHVSGGPLFRLLGNILNIFVYFSLYKFALKMKTDSLFTILAVRRCMEVDWEINASKDGFVRYEFSSGLVLGIMKESVQVGNGACAMRLALHL